MQTNKISSHAVSIFGRLRVSVKQKDCKPIQEIAPKRNWDGIKSFGPGGEFRIKPQKSTFIHAVWGCSLFYFREPRQRYKWYFIAEIGKKS